MKVKVNQEVIGFNRHTISDLLEMLNRNWSDGFVVTVNNSVVLKSQWSSFKLKEADSIYIILPTEGG